MQWDPGIIYMYVIQMSESWHLEREKKIYVLKKKKNNDNIRKQHSWILIHFEIMGSCQITTIWHFPPISIGYASNDLLKVLLGLLENDACGKSYDDIISSKICAGYPTGGYDACQVYFSYLSDLHFVTFAFFHFDLSHLSDF